MEPKSVAQSTTRDFRWSRAHFLAAVVVFASSCPRVSWADVPGESPAPAATASEPANPSQIELAKARYRQGAAAYAEGHYRDAIDAFLDADRHRPLPEFPYNIALAYDQMGDPPRALRWYREYVRRAGEGTDLSDAKTRIAEIERNLQERGLQQVTVLSVPEGATVAVDGRPVGITPWTGELIPGRHRAELTLPGHQSTTQDFDLPAHRAIDVTLQLQKVTTGATESAAPTPAPPPAADSLAPAESSGPLVRWPTWVMFGAGAATLGAAGVFEVLRSGAEDDIREAPTQREAAARLEDSSRDSHQTTARVLAGVGGGLLVTGGVLLVLDLTRSDPPPTGADVSASCNTAGCGVLARGRF